MNRLWSWLSIPLLLSTTAIGPCRQQPLGSLDGGAGCDYAGAHHAAGVTFPGTDGCNSCSCLPDGEVACTLLACAEAGVRDTGTTTDVQTQPPTTAAVCGNGMPMTGTSAAASGRIVFDSDRANFNRDIYMINADGSNLTRLTSDSTIEKEPSVSTDGRFMTFTSDRSGTMQIYLMDLSSRTVTPVTNQVGGADESSFSHDGTVVAFHSGPSVYVVHPDGTGLRLVATGLDNFNAYFFPHFTLDDTGLVFDRNNEIDTVALDGTGMRMVIQNTTTTIKSPSVSPATGDIVYNAYCGGTSVWTAPFSTKTNACEGARLSPVGEPTSQRAAWGPEDVFAYERVDASSNVAQIALISRTRGSVPCILTPDTADSRNPSWAP
jgi:dipeptidyl aminopeptidase/acylaminoacyl peptidase